MDRSSTYRIPVTPDALRAASGEAVLPSALVEPIQALVSAIARRIADGPLSIYLCSDDDSRQLRDDIAVLLSRGLAAHVPSALLVDCDFLHPGMHGFVPQKDALGFLDFLLYGSSIGVITQESRGAHVISTGSFPVTRRMPFVESAFEEASRRLAVHARCVMFVGPVADEAGDPHPLTGQVDVVSVVVSGERTAATKMSERVAERASDVWIVQLGAAPAPAPAPAPVARPEPVPPPPGVEPAPAVPAGAAPERVRPPVARPSSLGPRIAVIVFGVVVIAFAVWWFLQDRGLDTSPAGEPDQVASTPGQRPGPPVPAPADTLAGATEKPETTLAVGGADTSATAGARQETPPPTVVDPADTQGRTGGTLLLSSADIHVMSDLTQRFTGWYMVHVSSFQESVRAREEVKFLESREFPVFIVFLDLGAKGKWYRVYCGPFRTRDEAREVKKNLDAVPQVRFTRIAKIPE